jgi:hypothetical protein
MSRPLQWLFALFILALIAVEVWQNSVKWLFLCEVQWVALLCLAGLPLLAWKIDRALLLGAFEIETWTDGFKFALLLTLVAASILWTAQIELNLAECRLHEPIGPIFLPCVFGITLLVLSLLLNLVVTHLASNPPASNGKGELSWGAIDLGMGAGLIVGTAGFVLGEAIIRVLPKALDSNLSPSFVEVVSAIQSRLQWLPRQFRDGYIGHDGNLIAESSHLGAALLLVASGVLYLVFRNRSVAPLSSLGLLTVVLVWLLSGFAFFFQAFRIPTLLPLVVWLWLSSRHPKADHFYRIELAGSQRGTAFSSTNFLEPSDPDGRILVVAAAGGGIQAAAWTAQVLAGLKKACDADKADRFQNSLRAVSGVSGGSVGLMYFLAAQARGISDATVAARAAAESSLSQVTHALAYDDLCRAFCPFLIRDIYRDRGQALERAWVDNASERNGYADEIRNATLNTWMKATAEGRLPAVILNSTIAEEGQRLAFSTVPLPTKPGSEGFSEFTSLYPNHDVSISTAARLSATFTFVSPAARPASPEQQKELRKVFSAPTPGQRYENLHLVDGGYLDNSGITALVTLLRQKLLSDPRKTATDRLPKQILVLLINAFPLARQQYVKPHRGTFFQLWVPLLTLFTVRSAAHTAMAERELSLFKEALREVELGWIDFRFDNAVEKSASRHLANEPPPLSWHLTKAQKQAIIDAWAVMTPKANQVVSFLRTGKMPPSES